MEQIFGNKVPEEALSSLQIVHEESRCNQFPMKLRAEYEATGGQVIKWKFSFYIGCSPWRVAMGRTEISYSSKNDTREATF